MSKKRSKTVKKARRVKRFSIEVIEKDDNSYTLLFKNVPVTLLNSVRRAIISSVPTLAIERVFILKNESLMNDEMLAHRLGLIPLKTPLGRYRLPEEPDTDKPEYVVLTLSVRAEDETRVVYSSDIKSSDEEVEPISGDIEIVKLAPGQSIEAEMWAYMGRGREHSKWSPVTVAVVRGVPVIKIIDEECGRKCNKCIKACPKGVLGKKKGVLIVKNLYACTTCKLCEEACPDKIRVDIDENSSILYFESLGQLDPIDIINIAFDEVVKKLDEFNSVFSEVSFEDV
jgi:DNA-directed RNA polymerase subunit D